MRTLAIVALLAGCSVAPEPPATFSIDPDFPEPVAQTIRAAIDAWSEQVDWYPSETSDQRERGRIVFTEHTGKDAGPGEDVAGYNDGWRVVIDPGERSLDMVWTIVAHELGHWCSVGGTGVDGLGHTRDGLMAAKQLEPHTTIDADAVRAWREGCR